eukprot:CAMPEP_0113560720 /NCGR_PEP_ID=MMETSP0015_2-20120614/19583_1 /TAXON_ID=2838 /ORGANISM="Odontella" /LENGTH=120 /DNA_ID=CAMNT_0000462447 /DNA_START=160 /DNA_END=521 /DNA_ORIENTATION=+ /assembly_acc=CAM_ASM_000160
MIGIRRRPRSDMILLLNSSPPSAAAASLICLRFLIRAEEPSEESPAAVLLVNDDTADDFIAERSSRKASSFLLNASIDRGSFKGSKVSSARAYTDVTRNFTAGKDDGAISDLIPLREGND